MAAVPPGVLHKTVAIFAGITQKRLSLEPAPEATTDGTVIRVPFESPDAYELMEKELARVVFHSDAHTREAFIEEYCAKMSVLAKRHDVSIHEHNVGYLIGGIFDVLEAHRVLTLWSRLYAGSASRIYAMQREAIAQALDAQRAGGESPSVLSGLLAQSHEVAYDLGDLEHLRPYLQEALAKVAYRSPKSTLLVSRWLVSALVNQIIRDALGLPPPTDKPASGSGRGRNRGRGARGNQGTGSAESTDPTAGDTSGEPPPPSESDAQDQANQDPPSPPESKDAPQDKTQPESKDSNDSGDDERSTHGSESKEDSKPDADHSESEEREQPQAPPTTSQQREQPWHPPPVQSAPREKLQALNDLANNKAGRLPDTARSTVGDVQMPPMSTPEARDAAEERAREASKVNTNDPSALDEQLDQASNEAEREIEELEKAIQSQISDDDWLTKEIPDTVVIHDVRSQDIPQAVRAALNVLSPEDAHAVRRMRTVFGRVKGRAERALDHEGLEVDVDAFIERFVNNDNRPVFRSEVRGRGFKCLLLVDRSGTMLGEKTQHAERAYRILREALRFPFVDLQVWGFNSLNFGRTDLYRFAPDLGSFSTSKSPLEGHTPLHSAIDLAVNELRRGTERKVLFVLTDGFPEHFNSEGQPYGKKQLLDFVRSSVLRAGATNIRVVGTLIGELEHARVNLHHSEYRESTLEATVATAVSPTELTYMFGPPKNWKVLDPRKLGDELVSLVSDAFVEYLRGG